jgi:hypothetical protein
MPFLTFALLASACLYWMDIYLIAARKFRIVVDSTALK